MFEQASRFGGRETAWYRFALGAQEPLGGRRTHRKQLATLPFTDLEVATLLQ
jgi:hypothetical protein